MSDDIPGAHDEEPYDIAKDECIAQKLVPFGIICVKGSMVDRIVRMMAGIGVPLIGADGVDHPSRITLRFNAHPCVTTITIEDTVKP